MAKETAAGAATNGGGQTKASASKAKTMDEQWEEAGFQRVNPDVFFWKPATEEGDRIVKHSIRGIVLARAERLKSERDLEEERTGKKKDKEPQFFYLIALTASCQLRDHDKQPVPGLPGMVAWVDERFNLRPLQNMLPKLGADGRPERVCEVGIVPINKVGTRDGNNVWKLSLYRKDHDAAKAGVPLLSPAEATAMVQTAQSKAANAPPPDDDAPEGTPAAAPADDGIPF